MKRFINISALTAVLIAMLVSGCQKQLKTAPNQSLDPSVIFSTKEGIESAITGLYTRLKSGSLYGRDLIAISDALSDNGYATNHSGRLVPEAQNQFPTTTGANHFTTGVWINCYQAINQINLVLAAIPALNLSTVLQTDRDRWNGQLLFLRGFFYFDLIRVYSYTPGAIVAAQNFGGVPLSLVGIADPQSAFNYKPSRAPIDDIYTQIVTDVTAAEALLTIPSAASSGVNIANKLAAEALLAKVNLYRKNYSEAKNWADKCITNAGSRLTNTGNYINQWRAATSQEVLFQAAFLTAAENIGVNTSLQTSYTTLVSPGNTTQTGGFGDLVPTLTLLTDLGITLVGGNTTPSPFTTTGAVIASRNNDVRNLLFEPGTNGRGIAKVECTKFLGKSGAINLDNVPLLRIAEVYLTRAEAYGTPGSSIYNAALALADMKTIKNNRIINYTGSAEETADNALTGANLYEEVLRQRRIELAFEGHRFFDLKRLGRDLVKTPHYNNVLFTDARILPPIPQQDLDVNPNLKQNFGY